MQAWIILLALLGCGADFRYHADNCLKSNDGRHVKIVDTVEISTAAYYKIAPWMGTLGYGGPFFVILPAEILEENFQPAECLK